MNKFKINTKFYDVPDNGVSYSPDALQMAFVANGMTVAELKEELPKFIGTFDLYSDDGSTVVATYEGYTKLLHRTRPILTPSTRPSLHSQKL